MVGGNLWIRRADPWAVSPDSSDMGFVIIVTFRLVIVKVEDVFVRVQCLSD